MKQKITKGELIHKVGKLCNSRLKHEIIHPLKDSEGVYGYITTDFILCTREYIWKGKVSCHKSLLKKAIEKNLSVVMYINKVDKFYRFNPIECIANGKENLRPNNTLMMEFSIRLGRNYEK